MREAPGPAARDGAVGRREVPWRLPSGVGLAMRAGGAILMFLGDGAAAYAQIAHLPPSLAPPPMPPSAGPPVPIRPASVAPAPSPGDASAEEIAHLQAPAMVIDLAEPPRAPATAYATAPTAAAMAQAAAGGGSGDSRASADERFAARVSGAGVETARATRLRDLALIAPQGTVIPAYLQTAINSDLPGFVRAIVSQDVRGFDGSTVLIPRGSVLIGQYSNGVAAGQTRAFVVWSRVLTPDGVSVNIGSPSADELGRGGLDGETNSHFFRRFGAAILLSVVSAGTEALAGDGRGDTAIVIGSPQQATNVASVALQREVDIPTTISVEQGTPLRVFVARDLDFTGVVSAR